MAAGIRSAARLRARDDRGSANALTTALVFPVVMVFVMLAVQGGLYWHTYQRAEAAADRAAAVAARSDGTTASGEAAGYAFLAGAPLDNAAVSVTRGSDRVEATVTASAPALVMGISWDVTAHAAVEVERFIPEPDRQ